jgi:DNA invertase Pin-like site-specific DNA recombinase
MIEQPKPVRCAIYTRKSTEEGLEQEFNTLHAQRESAEAYILSHRQAGWTALTDHYDDGGFSGASIDRPALKTLLADVEARRIDCVLVYKVDRLSRSLLDFARLMELFERCGVSFVSVTQDFNTASSLGRLTLNVLLSFAQFEREIISERTRDKLSAARRKGKWIGGTPILGYDVDPLGRRLVVNQREAEQVRQMYRIYSEVDTLEGALRVVRAQGITSKIFTSKGGNLHPGKQLSRMNLRLLLSNVLYVGSVSHKGTIYAGEHEAIVDQQLWDTVNEKLKVNSVHVRGKRHTSRTPFWQSCCTAVPVTVPWFPPTRARVDNHSAITCAVLPAARAKTCGQRPVSSNGLETALTRQLQPMLGNQLSAPVIQQSLHRIVYDSHTRRVSTTMRDGTGFEFLLAMPNRGGVHRNPMESKSGAFRGSAGCWRCDQNRPFDRGRSGSQL